MSDRSDSDISAEYSAIKCLISDSTLIHTTTLRSEMFSDQMRRLIFGALYDLGAKGLKIDPVTILDRLPRERLDEARTELQTALVGFGAPANFAAYEAIVTKAFHADVIRDQAQTLLDDPEQLDSVLQVLTRADASSRWEYDQAAALLKAHALLGAIQDGTAGIPTGFPDLDRMTGGLLPGRLTVIGGRPAMGKTALGTTIAVNSPAPVGFISSEMSVDQITLRMLSMVSGVPLSYAMKGMDRENWDRWNRAAEQMRESPMMINDKPGITPAEIARQARKWTYNNGVKLVVVDYLQRLGGDPRKDRTERIRDAVTSCKEIARTLDIHVIALSQVKREIEHRPDKRPGMSDMDGAGTIEAEADLVLTLFRPWVYDRTQPRDHAEALIVKNRHGQIGTVHTRFDPELVRFEPAESSVITPF